MSPEQCIVWLSDTADEEKRLFAHLTGRRDHIRSVVTIALNTGMRRGEILGLQWEHVNFLARTIFIARSKTGRTRTIPMNNIVFKELMMLSRMLDQKISCSAMLELV